MGSFIDDLGAPLCFAGIYGPMLCAALGAWDRMPGVVLGSLLMLGLWLGIEFGARWGE